MACAVMVSASVTTISREWVVGVTVALQFAGNFEFKDSKKERAFLGPFFMVRRGEANDRYVDERQEPESTLSQQRLCYF